MKTKEEILIKTGILIKGYNEKDCEPIIEAMQEYAEAYHQEQMEEIKVTDLYDVKANIKETFLGTLPVDQEHESGIFYTDENGPVIEENGIKFENE